MSPVLLTVGEAIAQEGGGTSDGGAVEPRFQPLITAGW
jgi:hypothetical protein